MNFVEALENAAFSLVRQAVIYVPDDVKAALYKACLEETSEIAKMQLETILENIRLAEQQQVPVCQDTGTLTFYVKAGAQMKNLDVIEPALVAVARRTTTEVPLRPNAVNPFTQKNSGDNTGRHIPHVYWSIVPGDHLEVTVLAKGGGSENVSALGMLTPGEGINGVKKFVVDAVIKAGAQPCPPTILGVAVGGTADLAMGLAKQTLLKPLSVANEDATIAELEHELFDAVNMTGIGPMGLGGKTTVLGVHVDFAFRHPASFPVAVVFNCWAARYASARIKVDGTIEYLTHKNKIMQ